MSTVQELIEALSRWPPETRVVLADARDGRPLGDGFKIAGDQMMNRSTGRWTIYLEATGN